MHKKLVQPFFYFLLPLALSASPEEPLYLNTDHLIFEMREEVEDSREIPGRFFSEETLLNKENILRFISHPKVIEHYNAGIQKLDRFYSEITGGYLQIYQQPTLVQVASFLTYGIGDTSIIADAATFDQVQELQVRIFKRWLSLYNIGAEDPNLMAELITFCKQSSLDFFQLQVLSLIDDEEDYRDFLENSDLLDIDTNDDEEWLIWQELREKIPASEITLSPSFQEAESAYQEIIQEYFSRDAILSLFLDLIEK